MKKKIIIPLIVLLTLLSGTSLQAQEENAYAEGDKILNVGFSFGNIGYGFVGTRSIGIPPLTASLEVGIHEYVSVGGYAGIARWTYDWNTNYNYSWTFLAVGGRATFHYVPLLNEALDMGIDATKFDFYVSAVVGLEFRSWSSSYDDIPGIDYDNSVNAVFGPFLGWKYMFNPNFGIFIEGGRGALGWGTIGVSAVF